MKTIGLQIQNIKVDKYRSIEEHTIKHRNTTAILIDVLKIFDLTKLGLSSNTTFTNNTSPTIAAEENVEANLLSSNLLLLSM